MGIRGGDVSQGRRPEGRNRCWLARGKNWPRKRIVWKIRAGGEGRPAVGCGATTHPSSSAAPFDSFMRSSKRPSCSPAGSLVSTAAVIVLLAKDFLPLLLCWRGDRNYVIASRGALRGIDRRVRAFACDRARLG